MAAVAEVAVAEEIRLERIWACVDAGLVINPDGAASQVEGAISGGELRPQGTGPLRRRYVATATWEDYPILRFSEVPEIEIRFIDAPDEPALGLGEVGMGPTVAAIGNAVPARWARASAISR